MTFFDEALKLIKNLMKHPFWENKVVDEQLEILRGFIDEVNQGNWDFNTFSILNADKSFFNNLIEVFDFAQNYVSGFKQTQHNPLVQFMLDIKETMTKIKEERQKSITSNLTQFKENYFKK